MFSASSYHPDWQPLGHYKGYAVYLTTLLVVAHIGAMLMFVVNPAAMGKWLVFAPGIHGTWGEIWRWVTYPFVHQPSIWFVLEMFFLYRFGMELEKVFGRRHFATLYAGLVLLPALLVAMVYVMGDGPGYLLGGTRFSGFCLFLGFCFLYPGAILFQSLPWLNLKIAGSLLLAIYVLGDLAARQWMGAGLLLANVVLTYVILRRAGLTPRFEAIQAAFYNALPAPRPAAPARPVKRVEGSSARSSSAAAPKAYEPKIKPKTDLAPERRVVEEIDGLLDKIARSGMDSLTAAEKETLRRASARLKDPE